MQTPHIKAPNIVVIGGGTGSFTLLSGIKHYAQDVTALVNMADDGGSTGILRDELGVLPPGDIRQCLVALSNSEKIRNLFNYRFEEGGLKGHAFGNIFLSALEKMTGSFADAVAEAGQVLNISGSVIPMTLDKVTLIMEDDQGQKLYGEDTIGNAHFGKNTRPNMSLEPHAQLNPEAEKAILAADIVVIAPGNLYCSIAPALIVDGVAKAMQQTKAKKVYICNLVTKPGQTDDFSVCDYAAEIERFMDGTLLDYVIYNNAPPSEALLKKYAHEHEFPVVWDEDALSKQHYTAKGMNLVAKSAWKNSSASDPLASTRTYIRHDSDRVARELMRIYFA